MRNLQKNKNLYEAIDIWHLDDGASTDIILWRSENNTFLGPRTGSYTPLLRNENYILIDKKYKPVFEQFPDQVSVQEVKILEYLSKEEVNTSGYVELRILNTIDLFSIKAYESRGFKIWQMASYIFVSGELKKQIIKINKEDFNLALAVLALLHK